METTAPKNKKIYVVVSQSGSIVSCILKLITGKKYNHVSVALDDSLSPMYSFARKYKYWPFFGAFVKEYPDKGTLKRFKNAEIVVVEVPVTEEQYDKIQAHLDTMYENRDKYRYNYRGLFSAYFNKPHHTKHRYYCSEFVRMLLEKYGVISTDLFGKIVQPVEFLNLPEGKTVYEGKLRKYAQEYHKKHAETPLKQEKEEKTPIPIAEEDDCGVLV